MARKVFFSFYQADQARAAQVRSIGIVEGNNAVADADWTRLVAKGETLVQRWIDSQLAGRECTIVLIGAHTAGRRGIKYEIDKSWNDKKGLLGIYIHNLADASGAKSAKGQNPFDDFTLKATGKKMSSIVKAYDPLPTESRAICNYLSVNLAKWVEEAIRIRGANP